MSLFLHQLLGAAGEVVSPGESRVYAFLRNTNDNTLLWRQDVVVDGVQETILDVALPYQTVDPRDRVWLLREGLFVFFSFGGDTNMYKADGFGNFTTVSVVTLPAIPTHGPFPFGQRAFFVNDSAAYWSVVSNVSDWAGAGSGSNPWPRSYGRAVGVGFVENRIVIFFSKLAVEMVPTSLATSPFVFRELPLMEGARSQDGQEEGDKYRVATSRRGIYFHGQDNRIKFYDGSSVELVGHDDLILRSRVLLHYSPHLDMLIIANAGDDERDTFFVDPESRAIIGYHRQVSQTLEEDSFTLVRAIVDGWAEDNKLSLHVYYGDQDEILESEAYVHQVWSMDPDDVQDIDITFESGVVRLDEEMYLKYVDLQRIDRTLPAPLLTVTLAGEGIAEYDETFPDAQEVGNAFRYYVDRAGREFQLEFSGDGYNYRSTGTDGITMRFRRLLREPSGQNI